MKAAQLPSSRPAWQASWNNVDYWDVTGYTYGTTHVSKYDTFSVTLVDRSDVALGDFDIVFSYGGITWDTGDQSGGVNGLADPTQTSYPARYRLLQRNRRFWHVLRGARLRHGLPSSA